MSFTSSVGSSSPSMMKEVEASPSGNKGHKRSPPPLQGGLVMTCFVLVTKPVLTSPKLVTAPKSFSEPSDGSQAQPTLTTKNKNDSLTRCMLNSVDEDPALSEIFAKLLTLNPQDLSREDLKEPSSFPFL